MDGDHAELYRRQPPAHHPQVVRRHRADVAARTYTTYTDYDMSVVALVQQDGQTVGDIRYTDATPANTTLAGGGALTTTGPTAYGGATDDLWHRRDGFGNGNEVFTAGESGDENAPP